MTADEENRSELQVKNIRYQIFKIIAVYHPNYGIYILLLKSNHDINLIRTLFALTSGFKI